MKTKGIYAILYDSKGNEIESIAICMTNKMLEKYLTCDSVNKQVQESIAKYGKAKWKDFDSYEIRKVEK